MSAATTSGAEHRLGRRVRQQVVQGLTQTLGGAKAVFVLGLQGVPVGEVELLRRSLRAVSADLKVVKNTLGRRALAQAGFTTLESSVQGASVVGISHADPVAASKVLVTFVKDHEGVTLRAAVVEGQSLAAGDITALAALPSREVLIAKMLGSFQAPMSGLVGVLSGLTRQLVYVVQAIRKANEEAK